MTANNLRDVLLGLPELTLIGTGLLEASTGFFPVDLPRDTLREAVTDQLTHMGYSGRGDWSPLAASLWTIMVLPHFM